MTRNEYDIELCWNEEAKEFDWDEYQRLCDIADYWECEERCNSPARLKPLKEGIMKERVKYFIAYYGPHAMAWCSEKEIFVPYETHLYITYFDRAEDALIELRKVREVAREWMKNICIDSKLDYDCE